MYGNAHISEVK